jgi:hypothetical protein
MARAQQAPKADESQILDLTRRPVAKAQIATPSTLKPSAKPSTKPSTLYVQPKADRWKFAAPSGDVIKPKLTSPPTNPAGQVGAPGLNPPSIGPKRPVIIGGPKIPGLGGPKESKGDPGANSQPIRPGPGQKFQGEVANTPNR